MKVSIFSTTVPGHSGGSAINLQVLQGALKDLGHEVQFQQITTPATSTSKTINAYNARIEPHSLKYFFSSYDFALSKQINEFCATNATEIAVLYGMEALSLVRLEGSAKKWILLGDPYHLVAWEKIKNAVSDWLANPMLGSFFRLASNVIKQFLFIIYWKRQLKKVAGFDFGYATAAHHAKLYQRFNPKIEYKPSPVLGASDTYSRKIPNKFCFLYMGHNLSGTSNTAGVRELMLLRNYLNSNSNIKNNDWKIWIAGDPSNLSKELAESIKADSRLELKGVIELEKEANHISVLLNTIPHTLGNRTRIASCFAFGIPAISHRAAILGMPGLSNHGGAIIYNNDQEFLKSCETVLNNSSILEDLSTECLSVYREHYSKDSLIHFLKKMC